MFGVICWETSGVFFFCSNETHLQVSKILNCAKEFPVNHQNNYLCTQKK